MLPKFPDICFSVEEEPKKTSTRKLSRPGIKEAQKALLFSEMLTELEEQKRCLWLLDIGRFEEIYGCSQGENIGMNEASRNFGVTSRTLKMRMTSSNYKETFGPSVFLDDEKQRENHSLQKGSEVVNPT